MITTFDHTDVISFLIPSNFSGFSPVNFVTVQLDLTSTAESNHRSSWKSFPQVHWKSTQVSWKEPLGREALEAVKGHARGLPRESQVHWTALKLDPVNNSGDRKGFFKAFCYKNNDTIPLE